MGGFITPPPEYFKIVYRIVKNYGGLFISDEVQTGLGPHRQKMVGHRAMGSHAGHHYLRKKHGEWHSGGTDDRNRGIGGQISGTEISTFGGNPVTSVAARAVIEVIEEENLRENTYVVGGYFRKKLEELQQNIR